MSNYSNTFKRSIRKYQQGATLTNSPNAAKSGGTFDFLSMFGFGGGGQQQQAGGGAGQKAGGGMSGGDIAGMGGMVVKGILDANAPDVKIDNINEQNATSSSFEELGEQIGATALNTVIPGLGTAVDAAMDFADKKRYEALAKGDQVGEGLWQAADVTGQTTEFVGDLLKGDVKGALSNTPILGGLAKAAGLVDSECWKVAPKHNMDGTVESENYCWKSEEEYNQNQKILKNLKYRERAMATINEQTNLGMLS
jgi:hypothetical protein